MKENEILLREAALSDLPVISRHRRSMFEDMGYADAAALEAMQRASDSYLTQALADGSYRAWLAETAEGQAVAGGGIVISPWPGHPKDPQSRRAMILNIYTEKEFRHRGLARRVMQAMLDWLRREGFRTVALHASDQGRALYQSLGFEPTNEMRLNL